MHHKISSLPKKTFSKYKMPLLEVPDLVENQLESYRLFLEEQLYKSIEEFSPIRDYAGKKFEISFTSFKMVHPEHDEFFCKENKLTYEAQLKAHVVLKNKTLNSLHEQEIFLTEIPFMTSHGTFIINGVERVVVPQLARSYGIYFNESDTKKGHYFGAKIIPERGAWIEFEMDIDGVLYCRIDKKRKFPVTSLLRIFGAVTNEEILALTKSPETKQMFTDSFKKELGNTLEEAYIDIHKKTRDNEVVTATNAREYVDGLFSKERYDLSGVGRFQFNKRFKLGTTDKDLEVMTIGVKDVLTMCEYIISLVNTPGSKGDDIDHLGLRRVRYVGELVDQKVRKGMSQIKRNIQDKMSTIDTETTSPLAFVNQRPLQARVKEFFATSQFSQFMNQENVLSEVEHMRILSALGPGGLTRERAGFEVRDVHVSHYGRVCPVHTPEGPNIGLILHMATYAKVNRFGMIETPYVKVKNGKITGEVSYMNAMEEEFFNIAHLANPIDKNGKFIKEVAEVRKGGLPQVVSSNEVEYVDVASNQAFSVASSLIPFIENDAANRALMGSNMMKQATPCIVPMAPIVSTGMESYAARNTGRVILSREDGVVTACDGRHIIVKNSKGKEVRYDLVNYSRTNNYSSFHQRPAVTLGDKVVTGQTLADSSTTQNGELAVGQNVFMAFMCWRGNNYEDAMVVSEKLIKNSIFTTIRIEEYECVVRDTKLGEETTTNDIPGTSEVRLKDIDEDGMIHIGSEVRGGDILVGKITPKGETELSPEERLLRSIFGEKARDVKDTSLRMGHGKKGRVIGIKVFSRDEGHQLESGVVKKIYVEVAQMRNVQVGDKLAGRHGNKGVVSIILPEEDMPYMTDGTPIDLVLTPLGVPSRMNIGQVLEMHMGMAANTLGYQAVVPAFQGASSEEVGDELEKAGLPRDGKVTLYDGRTGEKFHQKVSVGYMYILKLHHMVDDKMHARSIGPYSLITQQPLQGKSQFGGQRLGEMEVWALEGYGAAYTLREMLTVKSDDIIGRSAAYDSIIKGEEIKEPNRPASFHVLLNYLRGLALDVHLNTVKSKEEEQALKDIDLIDNEVDTFYDASQNPDAELISEI